MQWYINNRWFHFLEYNAKSVGNLVFIFRGNKVFPPSIIDHCVALKGQNFIAHCHSVISQKNRTISYTAVKNLRTSNIWVAVVLDAIYLHEKSSLFSWKKNEFGGWKCRVKKENKSNQTIKISLKLHIATEWREMSNGK